LKSSREVVSELINPPEIWVGTADDYAGGREHGGWVDASRLVPEVMRSIATLIDRTPNGLGKRWAVHEVRNFGVWQPSGKDRLRDFMTVGQGIRIFGPPYSGLVSAVGVDSTAARFDRFRQSYLGSWPGLPEFTEQVVADSGWYEALDELPRTLRPFVMLDTKRLQREIRRDLTVVEHPAGIWVYDPRIW
jgi:hypothetical protein